MELSLEMLMASIDLDLKRLSKEMEAIAGMWNGKENDILEERAGIAKDIQEKSHELLTLMRELDASF